MPWPVIESWCAWDIKLKTRRLLGFSPWGPWGSAEGLFARNQSGEGFRRVQGDEDAHLDMILKSKAFV